MNKTCPTGIALAALLLCGAATAATATSEAQMRYQEERAACFNGTSNQDRKTCLQEANAALQEARKGNLTAGDLRRNGMARCNTLTAQDRDDCRLRMELGDTRGTARDGGIIRELTTVVPGR